MCGLELVEIGQILCPQAGTLQVAKRRQRVRHTTKESRFFLLDGCMGHVEQLCLVTKVEFQ